MYQCHVEGLEHFKVAQRDPGEHRLGLQIEDEEEGLEQDQQHPFVFPRKRLLAAPGVGLRLELDFGWPAQILRRLAFVRARQRPDVQMRPAGQVDLPPNHHHASKSCVLIQINKRRLRVEFLFVVIQYLVAVCINVFYLVDIQSSIC
jgi:hypothetical protein